MYRNFDCGLKFPRNWSSRRGLNSSGTLCGVGRQPATYVSEQRMSPVVKDQLWCLETRLTSCQPTPRNISEERTPHLHHIGSLESRVQFWTAVRVERNMRPQKGS